jgi:hypothetical protein
VSLVRKVDIRDESGNAFTNDNPLWIHNVGEISTDNSTNSTLLAGAVFTGTGEDIRDESVLVISVYSDVASDTDGLSIEFSTDNTNWDHKDVYTIPSGTAKTFTSQPVARYFRVVYTNGVSGQSEFRLQVIKHNTYVKPSSHRIQDSISTDDDAELTKAVITGDNGQGKFYNVKTDQFGNLKVSESAGVGIDAFGRKRISQAYTLLDFKQVTDNAPLFYDDAEVSGSGTTSTYQTNKASTRIGVSATTAGLRARQSKVWGTYQPGKSQLVFVTFANSKSVSGIKKQAGYYCEDNGIYHKHEDGTAYVGFRAYNTGSAVDTDVAQSSWNIDKMDGTGDSGITLDFSQSLIFFISFEWLGVGSVFVGWVINGELVPCHRFDNANINDEVYMSTPNAPIRYEIENDGTGAADTFDTICASVMSEGGQEQTAINTYVSRDGTSQTLANQDLWTPLVSIRLKSTERGTRITPRDISVLCTSNTNYEWGVFLNPTIGGVDAVSWSNITNSSLQYDITRDNTNTLTGGYSIAGGYGASTNQGKTSVGGASDSFLTIGSQIDGTADELVLAMKNIDANGGTAYGGFVISEYK